MYEVIILNLCLTDFHLYVFCEGEYLVCERSLSLQASLVTDPTHSFGYACELSSEIQSWSLPWLTVYFGLV